MIKKFTTIGMMMFLLGMASVEIVQAEEVEGNIVRFIVLIQIKLKAIKCIKWNLIIYQITVRTMIVN